MAGYLIMDDNGVSSSEEETVSFAQLAAMFKICGAKTKLGVSVFDFSDGENNALALAKGSDSKEYQLTEVFAETRFAS